MNDIQQQTTVNIQEKANLIWAIADKLVGVYKPQMSPMGSAACVSCFVSCLRLIYIRLIRVIRVPLKLKCFVFHPQATRTRGPKNPCYRCNPCGTKHKQVLSVPMFYLVSR